MGIQMKNLNPAVFLGMLLNGLLYQLIPESLLSDIRFMALPGQITDVLPIDIKMGMALELVGMRVMLLEAVIEEEVAD